VSLLKQHGGRKYALARAPPVLTQTSHYVGALALNASVVALFHDHQHSKTASVSSALMLTEAM